MKWVWMKLALRWDLNFDYNKRRIWYLVFLLFDRWRQQYDLAPIKILTFVSSLYSFPSLLLTISLFSHRCVVAVLLFEFFCRRLVRRLYLTVNNERLAETRAYSYSYVSSSSCGVCSKSSALVFMRMREPFKNRQNLFSLVVRACFSRNAFCLFK